MGWLKSSFQVLCTVACVTSLLVNIIILYNVYPWVKEPSFYQCDWPDTQENHRRLMFCARYSHVTFKELCRCNDPWPVNISPKPLKHNQLNSTPVAIVASNRAECLYRSLYSVLSADGANSSLITVFLDAPFPDPMAVAKLFNVTVIAHSLVADIKTFDITKESSTMIRNRIDKHYKLTISKMFDMFPDATQAILLEDDLQVSTDFFSYFSQTAHLLYNDSSLYCISAWNDFSYQHSSRDPGLLYRVDNMPGLGWMLRKSLYREELESKWPMKPQKDSWDGWLRRPPQRKGRECIMPDVCRTFHFSVGAHISSQGQQRYFNTHSFNKLPYPVNINTEMMTRNAYEELVKKMLRNAMLANHLVSVCSSRLIPDTTNVTYALYIKGNKTLLDLMSCLELWDVDYRPGHKNMWRFWLKGNHILLIQCPESEYCSFKPDSVFPIEETIPLFLIFYRKYIILALVFTTTVVTTFITAKWCRCSRDSEADSKA